MTAKKDAMKGDFSRITFDPRKRYTGVLQQQGRVQLDADWNEQVEIEAHMDRSLARDLIGACGAPRDGGGFEVSVTPDSDIALSAGRLYVEGTLCQLDAETTYSRQPDLPQPGPIAPADGRTDLLYLDVWQRHVTAVEDPGIREPALGGPDTTTRARTVAQVKLLRGVDADECDQPIEGWPPPRSAGLLAARIDADHTRGGEEIRVGAAFAGFENPLYRVEIHDPGPPGTATFKWSRSNGSVVSGVRELCEREPSEGFIRALLEPLGTGAGLGLREGDWVELLGEESELSLTPGSLVRVARVEELERVVWLEGDLTEHSREAALKLRRWDGADGAQPVKPGWVELDEGVVVELSRGPFATGDYWVFPARTGQEPAAWPSEPARGIEHGYGKLALVTWKEEADGGWSGAVRDCRPLFESLAGAAHERCLQEIGELRVRLEAQAREIAELRERLPG